MATNTTYDPVNSLSFEKTKLNKSAQGVSTTANLNGTTDLDLTLNDDVLMNGGGAVLVANASKGDYMDFQVLAPDGQGGFVLIKQFVTNWYVDWTSTQQPLPRSIYPAKLPAGFKLRLVYHSVATEGTPPWVAINYDHEKVLV